MAHESFEDEELAQFLNDNFVSIKVDREERPDVDALYMQATIAMTGHGGWPMSVFLNHEQKPFHAGTYFPPDPRSGMPSFLQVLTAVVDTWQQRRDAVDQHAHGLSERIAELSDFSVRDVPFFVGKDFVDKCWESFDETFGGFGSAPKFPPSSLLKALLLYRGEGEERALQMASHTLECMARGGIFDQLGGGFARYSVDGQWIVPHFEKMLYDNAQLLEVYTLWWSRTRMPLAKRVVTQTVNFMLQELLTPEGLFASALDADSEGEEGKFYAFGQDEIREHFSAADAEFLERTFSITARGTFEHGTSVLQLLQDPDDQDTYERLAAELKWIRDKRVRPGLDDKVVASWNGLAISALARAGVVFDQAEWIDIAAAAFERLVALHFTQRVMSRVSRQGKSSQISGALDDYSHVAYAALTLYQVTGGAQHLALCEELVAIVFEFFTDGTGGLFDTDSRASSLFARLKQPQDGAEPSGWLMTTEVLLQLAALTGEHEFRGRAEKLLSVVGPLSMQSPRSVGTGLSAYLRLQQQATEIAVVLGEFDDDVRLLRKYVFDQASPNWVLAIGQSNTVPLLREREVIRGMTTFYVCHNFQCELPVVGVDQVLAQLRRDFTD
jgi:uncharacterized protein YyaL (SSP411 family)